MMQVPDIPAPLWPAERLRAASSALVAGYCYQTVAQFQEALKAATGREQLLALLREASQDKVVDAPSRDSLRADVFARASALGVRLRGGGFRWSEEK
jgi:hypothetical protein